MIPPHVRRCAWAAALLCLAAVEVSAQSLKGFPTGPNPVRVSIGAYLIDFEQIDEATLSHKITAYLTAEWQDARLTKGTAPALDRDAVTLDQIWQPNIEIMNEYAPRQVGNATVTIDDEGRVKYEERFKVQLATDFDLRKFPFDRQTLVMMIESFRYGSGELLLAPRPEHELRSPAAFLPDWYILDARHRVDLDRNNPDADPYSRYIFEVDVQRKVGYYVWNVFLPLAFIALLPWAVFWINPADLRTRTSVSVTALLTAIALSLVITGSRPRVSYLTFFDALFLNTYFLIFLATALVVAADFTARRTGAEGVAERLSAIGRLAYPALFLVSNLVLALIFFRS